MTLHTPRRCEPRQPLFTVLARQHLLALKVALILLSVCVSDQQ